jgi:hypothetical protein
MTLTFSPHAEAILNSHVEGFKMATKFLCIYCTQLVSTINVHHQVSEHDMRPAIYFGGPRPRALGVDHVFGVWCHAVTTMSFQPPISDLCHPIPDPGLRHRSPSLSTFNLILHHRRCSPLPLWSRTFWPPSIPVPRHSPNDTEHHGTINVTPNP